MAPLIGGCRVLASARLFGRGLDGSLRQQVTLEARVMELCQGLAAFELPAFSGSPLKCATHAAAVKRTRSFLSSRAAVIFGTSDRSPRSAIDSSAAARTLTFLSPVALTSASPASGSGSWANFFAAAARTGEASFLVIVF